MRLGWEQNNRWTRWQEPGYGPWQRQQGLDTGRGRESEAWMRVLAVGTGLALGAGLTIAEVLTPVVACRLDLEGAVLA